MRKKGVMEEYIIWILIAVAFIVIMVVAIYITKGFGLSGLLERIKNIFRFR